MKTNSLLGLLTLLASSAALTNFAEASNLYSPPDQSNPVEAKISKLKIGPWNDFLEQDIDSLSQHLARGAWGNGRGVRWGNGGYRRRGWLNGGGYRPVWKNGYYGGGWRNGGGAWGNGGGNYVRW